jgi:hypothetical protein
LTSQRDIADPLGGLTEFQVIVTEPPCAIEAPSAVELMEIGAAPAEVPVAPAVPTETVVIADLVPPPVVWQLSTTRIAAVKGGVVATPLTLVLPAFAAVNAVESGLDIVQALMPLVTQPTAVEELVATTLGLAMRTIDGWLICTAHWALATCDCDADWLMQVNPYVAVLVPAGGAAITAVAEPES